MFLINTPRFNSKLCCAILPSQMFSCCMIQMNSIQWWHSIGLWNVFLMKLCPFLDGIQAEPDAMVLVSPRKRSCQIFTVKLCKTRRTMTILHVQCNAVLKTVRERNRVAVTVVVVTVTSRTWPTRVVPSLSFTSASRRNIVAPNTLFHERCRCRQPRSSSSSPICYRSSSDWCCSRATSVAATTMTLSRRVSPSFTSFVPSAARGIKRVRHDEITTRRWRMTLREWATCDERLLSVVYNEQQQ